MLRYLTIPVTPFQQNCSLVWDDATRQARAFALGIRPLRSLDNNDGHGFFEALGDAVVTGPTRTNVNDFRVVLIDAP